ncbi:hypothetical protein [Mycolicibacter arupensis]|jgi:hypothetical protein|uniref:Uncharacterized protein n=1 Tax=Mycolicibacter arupensis TaxID=342002 RepID=A0A0F5MV34_9MYCO|nr:hypothetical protein [Mycolicibacter arupensis]KKB98556.1 hypothetical protein WR43_13840 [Mycolicibacter arupensis]MCV7274131.1 hypothetical protein [Mycolicibacter arupensis]OQZ94089.1 hypothetical protein BST15_17215 [Mycolicibacter arupensis]TXI59978.1 MAG: hypothetical protein E6Q54_01550 [Mycolicibacter arupensis]
MSLEALQVEVQGYRTEAARLSEQFTQTHDEVEADPNLTTSGKRERLEPLHEQVTEQISALCAREKAAVKGMKEKLERRVFGLSPTASSDPAKVVSFRDAQARVREIEDNDDAAEIYESAKRSGDQILATAVLERALVRGWTSIRDDFLERNTAARKDVDDLAALAKYAENSLFNVAHYMPPSLKLPFPSGMPEVPPLNSIREPSGPRPLREGFGTW